MVLPKSVTSRRVIDDADKMLANDSPQQLRMQSIKQRRHLWVATRSKDNDGNNDDLFLNDDELDTLEGVVLNENVANVANKDETNNNNDKLLRKWDTLLDCEDLRRQQDLHLPLAYPTYVHV